MSNISESIVFEKSAHELEKKLKNPNLTDEQAAKIRKDICWYEKESRHTWNAARQEAESDAAEGY